MKDLKIAIYGAGAMGTVLGVLLTKGGLSVDLITRNGAHVAAMREKGATIVCEADGREITQAVRALFPHEMSGVYDVIFLMTKQRYNEEIVKSLLPHLTKEGIICTAQNGLPEESVAKIAGHARTYGAATSFGATFLEGGRVALTSKIKGMRMEVGGYKNDGEHTGLLVQILSHIGKTTGNEGFVKDTDNLVGARWAKLTINAAFSGLSVVTGLTFGEVARKRKSRKLALGILRECMAVAKAQGVAMAKMQGHDMEKLLGGKGYLQRLFAYTVLPFAIKSHKKLISGMLKDLQNGKACEIDFVNGVVVAAGEQVGVATPLCRKVVEITHGIEEGVYQISYQNTDLFD